MSWVFPPAPTPSVPVAGTGQRFPVRRVYCVGRNYAAHAREMGATGREPPFFFLKPADAVLPVEEGGTAELPYPSLTRDLHHEVELVAALGRGGRDIEAADALGHVFGYAVGLDMTRRDLQAEAKKASRPWCVAKAFERSAPVGPITPAGRAGDVSRAAIALEVNGRPRQGSSVSELIWTIGEVIAHLSAAWELQPGDLVFTGTPEGVGAVERGDTLVGTVEGLLPIRVRVV